MWEAKRASENNEQEPRISKAKYRKNQVFLSKVAFGSC